MRKDKSRWASRVPANRKRQTLNVPHSKRQPVRSAMDWQKARVRRTVFGPRIGDWHLGTTLRAGTRRDIFMMPSPGSDQVRIVNSRDYEYVSIMAW